MDINNIDPLTYNLRLKHPGNGKYVGLTITLNSTSNDATKKVERKLVDRRLKLSARGKNFNVDEVEDNGIEYLASAIAGWIWEIDDDGEPGSLNGQQPEFNLINARKLLAVDWIKDQIDEALADNARFFQK